jgi:CRP/FNR family transcriptional regulator
MLNTKPSDLSEMLIEALRMLEPWLKPRRYSRGEVLWHEGDSARELVVLDKGRVKIVRTRPDGTRVLVFIMKEGDVFGFMPLLDQGPYPGTAIALDDIEVRVTGTSELKDAVTRHPDLCFLLLKILAKRLRESFDVISHLSRRDAVGKVCNALLKLLPPDPPQPPFLVITLPELAHVFAQGIGLTPETFSRVLTSLVRQNILHRLGNGRFQVLDLDRLQAMALEANAMFPQRTTFF